MNRVVFFLGAGASRCAGGPLIADFVPAIESAIQQCRVPHSAAEAFGKLQREAEESSIQKTSIKLGCGSGPIAPSERSPLEELAVRFRLNTRMLTGDLKFV